MTLPDQTASNALADLDDEQRAAAHAVRGPVCIVAGAGTGKTRTVTHRIAHAVASGEIEARSALAITHSRKAATELAERLVRLGVADVDAWTFHAAGLRVARRFWSHTGRPGGSPRVASDRETWGMWRDALRAVSGEPDTATVRDVADEVGWARSRLVGIDDYATAAVSADRRPGISATTVVDAWSSFSQIKGRLGLVDFADLLEIAADLLVGDAQVAQRVRRRWSYVTVDEYQDTDPAQQRLLDAVLGSGVDVCVVGDPRQAIYSWKGADPSFLSGFSRRYPAARVFELTHNYRSTPQILDWANKIAADHRARPAPEATNNSARPAPEATNNSAQPAPEATNSARPAPEATSRARPLVATRPAGPTPMVTRCPDEAAETRWVVARAARAVTAGTPASEIAILYRFNATQARFEAAFAQADIAATAAEDTAFFDRVEIMAVLAAVQRAARAQPDQPGVALLESTLHGVGFDRDTPPAGQGAARARWESQQALLDMVASWPDVARTDAAGLVRQFEQLAARAHGPPVAGVTLATLHRAKGLEWDTVFIVGAHDGAIPASYATQPEEEAEEERLLYVGMTRARRELHITWPATNARGWVNRPSPYLDLLPGRRATPPISPKRPVSPRTPAVGEPGRTWITEPGSGHECPVCSVPLKGLAARRLGVCAECVTQVPGATGERARALAAVIEQAAATLGVPADRVVSATGLLRLLDQRPGTADEVGATTGVNIAGTWAEQAVGVLAK